ncbi:MAG: inorganic diphosphatase [Flavobacteriaceae bacterium]|jgi:inorganic pyrophosphatase|nr:inorganic diphosphatase [Flavobacteriaceae bacterium]
MKFISILFLFIILISCESKNVETYPLKSEDGFFHAVIEIPAGTNAKYEFNSETLMYEIDQRDGENRIIQYLPYFGNYGFIPSTLSAETKGGDGDPLDIFVLSEAIPQGSFLPVIPIGTVQLIDNGELDYKIIAVPADQQLNILKIKTLNELKSKHPSILQIIEVWLTNYDSDELEIEGWLDEFETEQYILENSL